jgi:[acyl-carrier-protein] S-malonyltransferase
MAAVLALPDEKVEEICEAVMTETGEVVVAANYNCPWASWSSAGQ